MYKTRCARDREAIFLIDATGGVIRSESEGDPAVFLYQCMLVTHEGSVPVFQMVSADQTALQIAHFLASILAQNVPIPPVVVTD